jgi:hypothetical protein
MNVVHSELRILWATSGIPNGLNFPFFLGIYFRFSGIYRGKVTIILSSLLYILSTSDNGRLKYHPGNQWLRAKILKDFEVLNIHRNSLIAFLVSFSLIKCDNCMFLCFKYRFALFNLLLPLSPRYDGILHRNFKLAPWSNISVASAFEGCIWFIFY